MYPQYYYQAVVSRDVHVFYQLLAECHAAMHSCSVGSRLHRLLEQRLRQKVPRAQNLGAENASTYSTVPHYGLLTQKTMYFTLFKVDNVEKRRCSRLNRWPRIEVLCRSWGQRAINPLRVNSTILEQWVEDLTQWHIRQCNNAEHRNKKNVIKHLKHTGYRQFYRSRLLAFTSHYLRQTIASRSIKTVITVTPVFRAGSIKSSRGDG